MSKATFDIDPGTGSQIVPSGTMEEKVTKVAYRYSTATSRKNYTVQYYVLYYSK